MLEGWGLARCHRVDHLENPSKFDGTNVTDFLDQYQDMCEDCELSFKEMIKRLPRYCEPFTGVYIKSLAEFVEKNFDALRKLLLKEYKTDDTRQQMDSRSFLKAYKNHVKNENEMETYCRRFAAISNSLVKRDKLNPYTRSSWFLQGLPHNIRQELFYRYKIGPDKDDNFDFDTLFRIALSLAESEKRLTNLARKYRKSLAAY